VYLENFTSAHDRLVEVLGALGRVNGMILELEPFLVLMQHEKLVQLLPLELQLVFSVLE